MQMVILEEMKRFFDKILKVSKPIMENKKHEVRDNWKREMSLQIALENAKHSIFDQLGIFDGDDPELHQQNSHSWSKFKDAIIQERWNSSMYEDDEDSDNGPMYADVSKQIHVKLEAIVDACLLENNRLLQVEDDEEVVKGVYAKIGILEHYFLDNLEMAFLVSGRDDEATKLRAFPLVLREGAKAWYQTLAPEERRDWETLKTAFIEEFRHQEPPEEIWRQLLELRQTSPNDYKSYEGKFSNLWEKWCASLEEGERAPECLKKDWFLAGLYPILREKVKVKFPDTFEKAMAYAREKDRKLKFQAQLQGGMEPPPPAQTIARTVARTSATDQESSQQELLQQITNQLESLSINLVQGIRAPQSGTDRNRQEGQRQTREYVCYNCGEVGHGMYFCPHPRRYQGNGNHRRAPRQQVTPPRARPPNGQQNAPVAPPIQILRPPPPPPQTPAEIPPLPSGGEDRAVSVINTEAQDMTGVMDNEVVLATIHEVLTTDVVKEGSAV
ncbi:hypothetical protein L7F22_062005 [Adiantum nelumboides]|nr:hypothetical protein [Adiantum nelumboides]